MAAWFLKKRVRGFCKLKERVVVWELVPKGHVSKPV